MPSKAIDDETMDAALLEPSRPVIEYPEYVRADFVRRVYGLVATQLAATGGVAAWLMLDVRARADDFKTEADDGDAGEIVAVGVGQLQ